MSFANLGYAQITVTSGMQLEYAFSYCSPFIILEAVAVFLLFKQIDLKYKRTINILSKGSFTVYLVHGYFLSHIGVERFLQGSLVVMLIHIACSAIAIYLIGWCVYWAYGRIMRYVWAWLKDRIVLPEFNVIDDKV